MNLAFFMNAASPFPKKARWTLLVIAAAVLVTGAAPTRAQSPDTTGPGASSQNAMVKRAKAEAKRWLGFIDRGEYEASWTEASDYLQSGTTAEQWAARVRGAHASLDSLHDRTLVAARHTTTHPELREGSDAVVVQYRSTYETSRGVRSWLETVTVYKGREGWGVVKYLIRPEQQ